MGDVKQEQQATPGRVRRRRVIYIPGYDPFHARRYRELYRTESAAQAEVSGYQISMSALKSDSYSWTVEARIDDADVRAQVSVLGWADIVKTSMTPGITKSYLLLARTSALYITSGALWQLMRLRKGPVIAALYPVVVMLLQLVLALLVAWGLGWAIGALTQPWAGLLGLGIVVPILRWFRGHDGHVLAWYLMLNYAFTARVGGANPPELEERMAEFGDLIAEALDSDVDEVLVVGHSSGAHLGVSILSDLIRDGRVKEGGPVLSFLTLGQVVPMVSFLPTATRLRRDLNFLCTRDEITWIDFTAPGDGCAFALCDPVSVSGVAPAEGKRWPLVLSSAFTQTLSPARWKELRWKFFRLHFQYLCAFDRPGDYDYFRITAGPQTLEQRFGDRAPSKSRIETPVSPHRSMAS